ncbi:Nn.00g107370.m01.CDS01 [Neocucurbitaria sp. VM-36]
MADPNISTQWDENEKRWYRLQYVNGQWVFLDWLPVNRRDSGHHPNTYASSSSAGPAFQGIHVPNRVGNTVAGTYDIYNPVAHTNYESLDPLFYVRDRGYFQEGRLFSVLFTESAGHNALNAVTDYNTALSRVRYNEYVHTQVRRFIIVRQKREFCYAVPIFSYSGQGTLKNGVVPDEHAIAYSYGQYPQLIPGEQQLSKTPICVVMNQGEQALSRASRIYFGIHHPIQYNVKVKDLGYVHPEFMPALRGYWNMENGNDTRQAADVTDAAAYADDDEDEDDDDDGAGRSAHR